MVCREAAYCMGGLPCWGLEPGARWPPCPGLHILVSVFMTKSTKTGISKKKRGRPTLYEGSQGKGAPQIGLRLPPNELAAIDAWIKKHPDSLSRPMAIRRLVEIGLKTRRDR